MSRDVPAALAAYMAGNGLHMTKLTKMGPLPDGTYRYFSHATNSYTYDDGTGAQTYVGRTGMEISAFVSSSDLGVDNSEANTLPAIDGYLLEGFTTDQIKTGELDAVPYVTYCVNYTDLSKGHFVWAGGTVGEQRIKGTSLINLEQRSLTNKFKQNIVQSDSVHCRAIFGSQSASSASAGEVTEKYPCGYDFSADWHTFTVSAVHPTDTDLVFYTDDLGQASNFFRLGMVRWTTGDNVGHEREISSNTLSSNDQTMTLAYGLPHPVQVGDIGQARFGCDKLTSEATGCRRFFGTEWVLHYRGEPYQPSGDVNVNLMGGAGVPSGSLGGTGENPTTPPLPPVPPASGGAGTPGSPPARTIGATVETPSLTAGTAAAAANSTAINNAFAALPGGGGIVRIPAGTWYIDTSNPVTLDIDNARLDLATNNATLRAAHSTTTTSPSVHRDVVRVDGATEWEIVGGTIIGYLDTWVSGGGATVYGISEWAHGIYVTDSSAGTIKNITITNCVGDGISIGRTASDAYVDNPAISNCRRQGISTGGDTIVIDNFDIGYIGTTHPPANGPWAGIDVEVDSPETATNITIRNGRTHHNKGPGLLAVVRTSNITIFNVTSDYNQNYGLLASNADTGTVKGCTFEHNKYHGAKFENDSDGWTVGGATATSTDKNRFFNNYTSVVGVITSGNTSPISGENSATDKHVFTADGSSVTVLFNDYGP